MVRGIERLVRAIQSPPGRKPEPMLMALSQFYNSLPIEQRQLFKKGMELAAKQSINNILNVLDGAMAIEDSDTKGELLLIYDDGTQRIRLNAPEATPLSEIFRQV